MIEILIKEFLEQELEIPAYLEKPKDDLCKYVIVEKIGGSKTNYINNATFAIQSIADSMFEAAELNELVKNAMDNIIVLNKVSKSSLNSDYNFTDTTTKKYRYQAVYDLVFY